MFQTKLNAFLVFLLVSLLGFSVRAGATAPTYSVSVGSGSFSPNPICGGMTATASLTGTLNVQNPDKEIQESGDSWGWSASVTGYASSSQSAFGAVPSGTITPSVSATSGSATTTVSATADQTTSPGYYQVTVTGTDRFTLTDSSTSPPTVTSQSKSGPTTLNITVVTIGSIQYKDPQSGWIACPSPLYVMKGTSVQFKAIPSPSDASFPSGNPTWSGSASGSSATASASFSTASTSLTNYMPVTATCGSSVTVNAVVYTLASALSPQDDFVGRSYTTYGLGETINLSFQSVPAVSSANIGGLQWFLNSGGGAPISGSDGTANYACATTADSPTLALTISSGPSAGMSVPVSISVVAPTNAYGVLYSNVWHNYGYCSVGFEWTAYYLPKNVSFYNLKFLESQCPASTATGMWIDPKNYAPHPVDTTHYPGGQKGVPPTPLNAGHGNAATGSAVFGDPTNGFIGLDTAQMEVPYWDNGGTEVWPIPWTYSVSIPGHVATPYIQFTTATQQMVGDAAGTATISKKGLGPYSKAVGSPSSQF